MVHLGNEAPAFCRAASRHRSRGAVVRIPRPVGGQTSQAPGSGPEAAKPFCESVLGRWTDLTSAQLRAQTAEQGVLAPATVRVRGQPGAAWNALLLLQTSRASPCEAVNAGSRPINGTVWELRRSDSLVEIPDSLACGSASGRAFARHSCGRHRARPAGSDPILSTPPSATGRRCRARGGESGRRGRRSSG
jgi:hypothetical protein